MKAIDTSAPGGGFLSWLGIGPGRTAGEDVAPAAERHSLEVVESPVERRRRLLLEDIRSFLLAHGLEVSPWTLMIAYEIMTGGNPDLSRAIENQVSTRRPVTVEWLREVYEQSGEEDAIAGLTTMMGKLESVIDEFAQTASAAKSATSEYNIALEASVSDLREASEAGNVLNQLATIARDMLARTQQIEVELARSEKETRSLQECLAEARREAEIDHLTGLPNRRAFETVFNSEIETARATGEPLCVAFCDIDHFKRINDTHGHDAGDRVLRMIAQTLAKISKDKCHVARHGGEEFVILMRGRSLDTAWEMLDEAREGLASRRLVNRSTDIPFGQITFSAGIAEVQARERPRDALKCADEALYAAKERGRNCILRADQIQSAAS